MTDKVAALERDRWPISPKSAPKHPITKKGPKLTPEQEEILVKARGGLAAPRSLDYWAYICKTCADMSASSDVQFGRLLRRRRLALLLTTEEVSELLGILMVDIREIEEGCQSPTPEVRERIKSALFANGNGLPR